MMSPLPSISQVYSMLIQEEKQRKIRSASHFLSESGSLAVEAYKPSQFHKGRMNKGDSTTDHFHGGVARNEGKKSNLFCSYCKKPGHSIDKCYRFHGFPPNFKFKGVRRAAALVQTEDQERSWPSSMLQNSQTAMAVPGLTPEQSSQLIALLQNVQLQKTTQGPEYNTESTAFTSFACINASNFTKNLCLLSSMSDWDYT